MTRSVHSKQASPLGVPVHAGQTPSSPSTPPSEWIDRLIESLAEQSRFLGELHEVASDQVEAFEGDDASAILDILSQRSRLLAGAADVDDTVRELLERWRRVIELNTPGLEVEQVKIASLIGEVERLRELILASDRDGQLVLERRRAEVAESLAGTRRGRSAVHAYGAEEPRGPRFQDREL